MISHVENCFTMSQLPMKSTILWLVPLPAVDMSSPLSNPLAATATAAPILCLLVMFVLTSNMDFPKILSSFTVWIDVLLCLPFRVMNQFLQTPTPSRFHTTTTALRSMALCTVIYTMLLVCLEDRCIMTAYNYFAGPSSYYLASTTTTTAAVITILNMNMCRINYMVIRLQCWLKLHLHGQCQKHSSDHFNDDGHYNSWTPAEPSAKAPDEVHVTGHHHNDEPCTTPDGEVIRLCN